MRSQSSHERIDLSLENHKIEITVSGLQQQVQEVRPIIEQIRGLQDAMNSREISPAEALEAIEKLAQSEHEH